MRESVVAGTILSRSFGAVCLILVLICLIAIEEHVLNHVQRGAERDKEPKKLGWRLAFPKQKEFTQDYVDRYRTGRLCIFVMINSPPQTFTERFAAEYWTWAKEVTVRSLSAQTYKDFELLVVRQDGLPPVGHAELPVMNGTSEEINSLLNQTQRLGTCQWVITTRASRGWFKPDFMQRMVSKLLSTVGTGAGVQALVQAVVLSNRRVRTVTVDGRDGERCQLGTMQYSESGSSIGQTLAVRYDSWKQIGGLTVLDSDSSVLLETVRNRIISTRLRGGSLSQNTAVIHVPFEREDGYQVQTRLDPTFPWIMGVAECDTQLRDFRLKFWLRTFIPNIRFPVLSFLDACISLPVFRNYSVYAPLFSSNQTCNEADRIFPDFAEQLRKPDRQKQDAKKKEGRKKKGRATKKKKRTSKKKDEQLRKQDLQTNQSLEPSCVFVIIDGVSANASGRFINDFWEWTEYVTIPSLAAQENFNFTVLADLPEGKSTQSTGNMLVARGRTREDVTRLVIERNASCGWITTVRLEAGSYLHPDFIQNLIQYLESSFTKHPRLAAIGLYHDTVDQSVFDVDPEGNVRCKTERRKYKSSESMLGRAVAIRYGKWMKGGGLIASECDHLPLVQCLASKVGRNAAHGKHSGPGVELITRIHANFPWGSPLTECDVDKEDANLGSYMLRYIQRINLDHTLPATPFMDACLSIPTVARRNTSTSYTVEAWSNTSTSDAVEACKAFSKAHNIV